MDELIRKGEELPVHKKRVRSGGNYATGKVSYREVEEIDYLEFIEWRTNCITILEQVVPKISLHRSSVDTFQSLANNSRQLTFGISFLRSLREDIDRGFLQSLAAEIESEITADYMRQAENLLKEGSPGKYDHVPAAVLAGAVLEKSLKTICSQLSPPEHTNTQNGSPLKLNALIDALKKRDVYNELTAKQLRAWADIRNQAAHGNFDEFNKDQVGSMISGINNFLIQYL